MALSATQRSKLKRGFDYTAGVWRFYELVQVQAPTIYALVSFADIRTAYLLRDGLELRMLELLRMAEKVSHSRMEIVGSHAYSIDNDCPIFSNETEISTMADETSEIIGHRCF